MKRWTFEPSMNIFDFVCILAISQLMSLHSLWWMLLYLIVIPISATMQNSLEKQA